MGQIQWRAELETGIQAIDQQHQEFLRRLNLLLDACATGKGGEELQEAIDFVERYAHAHFMNEERMIHEAGYPHTQGHLDAHAQFFEDLAEIKQKTKEPGNGLAGLLAMNHLMANWFIKHIGQSDKAFAQFYRSTGKHIEG